MTRTYTKEQLDQMATKLAKNDNVERLWNGKSPNTEEPWVGVEIEFYTKFDYTMRIFANSDIADYLSFSDDQSIELNADDELGDDYDSEEYYCFELQVCAPESKIREVLGKSCSILRYIKAKTNSSCGLHIHLDHRFCVKRNPVLTFNNLLMFQGILFGVTDEDRLGSQYCVPVDESSDFYNHLFKQMEESDYDEDSRYYAINLIALRDTRTIEIRIFSGTTKYREILHYLNLVLGATRSEEIKNSIEENNIDIVKTIPYGTRNFVKNKIRKAA